MTVLKARTLVPGTAAAEVALLTEPLSFWGGFDLETGRVADRQHPQLGESLSGKVLVMTSGRGSSSASSVLAEAIRSRVAPAGIILKVADPILTLGALVATELYDVQCPVVQLAAWQAFDSSTFIDISAQSEEATLTVRRA